MDRLIKVDPATLSDGWYSLAVEGFGNKETASKVAEDLVKSSTGGIFVRVQDKKVVEVYPHGADWKSDTPPPMPSHGHE